MSKYSRGPNRGGERMLLGVFTDPKGQIRFVSHLSKADTVKMCSALAEHYAAPEKTQLKKPSWWKRLLGNKETAPDGA